MGINVGGMEISGKTHHVEETAGCCSIHGPPVTKDEENGATQENKKPSMGTSTGASNNGNRRAGA